MVIDFVLYKLAFKQSQITATIGFIPLKTGGSGLGMLFNYVALHVATCLTIHTAESTSDIGRSSSSFTLSHL
jgi:hypothetical protein